MLLGKLLLGFTGVIFSLYGVACFVDPAIPAGYMGVDLNDTGGPVEFIAMYGGLQLAVGLYLAYCAFSPGKLRQGLVVLAVVTAGLGIARSIGLMRLGIDSYNLAAAVYELTTMVIALVAMKRQQSAGD